MLLYNLILKLIMVVFHVNMQSFSVIDLYLCLSWLYSVLFHGSTIHLYIFSISTILGYCKYYVCNILIYSFGKFTYRRNIDGSKRMHILYCDDSSVAPAVLDKLHIPYHGVQGLHLSLYFISCPVPPLTICPWVTFEPLNCSYCNKSYFSSLGLCRCGSFIRNTLVYLICWVSQGLSLDHRKLPGLLNLSSLFLLSDSHRTL